MGSIGFAPQTFAGSACSLNLEWQSSSDATVTGYALYYGATGTPLTNRLNAGMATSVVLKNLIASTNYSFYVVAYDAYQNESQPSNFLFYTAPAISSLRLSQSTAGVMTVSFRVAPTAACHVEYTDTLTPPNWQLLNSATGDSNGIVTITDPVPAPGGSRFYRASVP